MRNAAPGTGGQPAVAQAMNPGAGQGFYDYYAGSWHPRGASRLFDSNITVPSGNTVANTVAETAFTTQPTFAANTLRAGDVIHCKMNGLYSTALVAPTLTAKIKIGSVLLITTGALASFIANTTNQAYSADVWITVDSIGAGGTVEAHAQLTFSTSTVATFMSNIANTATIAVNTTISNALSTTITWSVANASNTITLRQSVCELLR